MGNGGFASTSLMLTKLVPKIHFPCRALTRLLTPRPDVTCFHFLTHTQDTIRSSWLKKTRRRPHSSLHVARTVSYGCLSVGRMLVRRLQGLSIPLLSHRSTEMWKPT